MHLPQPPVGWPLPTTAREEYQRAVEAARAEMLAARAALQAQETEETGRRYAYAVAWFDRVQALFPFVGAGFADTKH